jgi:hypothetical protein
MLRIGATQTYCDPIRAGIHNIQDKTHEVASKAKMELWHRLLTHYLPLLSTLLPRADTKREKLSQRVP